MMIIQKVHTFSDSETEQVGENLAKDLQGGMCIELRGDMGCGKTTFVRGLVRGLGANESVQSPTFTIGKRYDSGRLTVYHYDFYRLNEPGLVAEELAEGMNDPGGVSVIEWAGTVAHVLPENRLIVDFEKTANHHDERSITIRKEGK